MWIVRLVLLTVAGLAWALSAIEVLISRASAQFPSNVTPF